MPNEPSNIGRFEPVNPGAIAEMRAFDKLPAGVRKALANAHFSIDALGVLGLFRLGHTPRDLINAVVSTDRRILDEAKRETGYAKHKRVHGSRSAVDAAIDRSGSRDIPLGRFSTN